MIFVGYARVSTQDQNPQLQLDALKEANCSKVFCDRASGSKRDRPELTKCLAYCEQLARGREKVALVIWKLDRASRSLTHLCDMVGHLSDNGIGFRCLTQAIDTTTPGGKLVFHIFAAIAEFERELNRERTLAGLAAARRRGVVLGGRPKIAEARRAEVLGLLKGNTRTKVCEHLGVTPLTLRRFLGESPPQRS